MGDYNNRQLAQIIAQSAEKINNSILKEQKIANELEKTVSKLQNEKKYLQELDEKMESLKNISIKPDLSALNSFYESKTEENIKRLNSRLKVPNLSLYVWLSSLAMLLISFFALYLAYSKAFTTRAEILEQYRAELLKENAIIPKEQEQLLKDMDQFFRKNPKTKDKFVEFKTGKK
ncbi:hypothetical protein [Chryseobacterium sp. SL1]|uniref:hypothetical protein n=1 Tax=Chryseobacterium sp. SL1 TaxID=2995159 RepID=UPI002276BA14|nr:hypothetical protein [Chryseobacterium sp. SL1]MCY1659327.1 hypothetical protein [Chryseobacterium sp. SL1]MCY1659333.1 hypothetical protein [Chryseobacterium sp. SL1]